jgi:hypothetical protein
MSERADLAASQLAETMIDAARAEVPDQWPLLEPLAETELRLLAQSIVDLSARARARSIDESIAHRLAHIHQLSARNVLVTVEGLGLLAAEQTIRAGIRAVTQTVNTAARFALL